MIAVNKVGVANVGEHQSYGRAPRGPHIANLAQHVARVVEPVGREVRQNAVLHRVVALVSLVQVDGGERQELPHEQYGSGDKCKN